MTDILDLHLTPRPATPGEEAQSPFLPGTNIQFAWDSTSLGWLKTCPRLYQYHMIEGWTSRGAGIHLKFGQELHTALEDFEHAKAEGLDHNAAVRRVVKDLMVRTFDWWSIDELKLMRGSAKMKSRKNLIRAVIWYLDTYKDDPAKTYIRQDGRPAVELSFRLELEWGPHSASQVAPGETQSYLLCGHLDKVVEHLDALWVMDHKTLGSTPTSYYFDGFSPSNQMTLYSFAGQVMLKAPIKGVIIDAIQVAEGFIRCARGFTNRTDNQLGEWVQELSYWFSLAEEFATRNYWPMNDTSCDKFGGCEFRGVCSRSPQVREHHLKAGFEKGKKWNPLEAR